MSEYPVPPLGRAPGVWTVLAPKWRGQFGRWVRGGEIGSAALFGALALGFWGILFGISWRVLHYLSGLEVGMLLAQKILDALLVGFASILLLSNLIAALSTFFLARDLDLLVAAPLNWFRLYLSKLVETAVHASWMIALLALPVLAAYGVVFHGGPLFLLVAVAALVPFFVLPAVAGAALMLLLVNIFPARRTRDLLGVVAIAAAGGLVLLIRIVRPELLFQPGGMSQIAQSLAALHVPAGPFMPTRWVSDMLMNWLSHVADPLPIVLLYTTAAAFVIMGGWLHGRLFRAGYSLAREGAERFGTDTVGRRMVAALLAPLPTARREFVLKDLRLFFRDPTQWGQLILVVLLIAVYILNIRALPIFSHGRAPLFLVTLVVFLNLGLSGFVLAAIAARFVFPAISLEGRQMWLLRSAPVDPRSLFRSKYWMTAVPLAVLGLVITLVTDVMLRASPFMLVVSAGTIVLFSFAATALALTFGTFYPQFTSENAAQIPTSFGGVAFMMSAVSLLGLIITIEAVPVASYLRASQFGETFGMSGQVAVALIAVLGLCAGTAVLSLRLGMRRMQDLEC
ncbi:MAG: putative ABC transporter permease subunit [Bacillota bacterium]